MMGQQTRKESLFYYFRLEEQIPEDHLLRLIDHHVDLSFVRERLRRFYSWTGRPSIDPEVLLRCCWSAICTGSRASAACWKKCACTWPIAGSRGSTLVKRSPTTPPFRRIGTDAFASQVCFAKC